ncbi:SGNH/GDSL hydrolase family protein [Streptomyces erythrochromogenes]|uniref:hypothetical protein n=1 Tax=Streptomyces erythrochromogenes TaxID=285574 RepID=UPI00380453F7
MATGRKRKSLLAATAAVSAALSISSGALMSAPSAAADPASPHETRRQTTLPRAVVSLGDSYISGEGGMWYGNADTEVPLYGNRYGTDRSFANINPPCNPDPGPVQSLLLVGSYCYQPKTVYQDAFNSNQTGTGSPESINYDPDGKNGCDRSDVAEIRQLALRMNQGRTSSDPEYHWPINLACSGAETQHLISEKFKKEWLQVNDLGRVAAKNQVKVVALSIGGNDMGFGEVAASCILRYVTDWSVPSRTSGAAVLGRQNSTCIDDWDKRLTSRLQAVRTRVTNVLNAIKSKMQQADPDGSYRLVLQSYPQMVPAPADNRYPVSDGLFYSSRTAPGGCPFDDKTSTLVRGWVKSLSDVLAESAYEASKTGVRVDFLDLESAFAGHEVCHKSSKLATKQSPAASNRAADMEWMRYVVTGLNQGQKQEALHPNAFGQRAIGNCLHLLLAKATGSYKCTNTAGQGTDAMKLAVR